MPLDEHVSAVQRLYPLLYVACHAVHGRQAEPVGGLSARQCAVLSHLIAQPNLSATEMAQHLGLARSTLSEVVLRLVELRYLDSHADQRDERKRRLVLTEAGRKALSSVSVLDEAKVAAVLSRLTSHERETAVKGLALLARAAASAFQPTRT